MQRFRYSIGMSSTAILKDITRVIHLRTNLGMVLSMWSYLSVFVLPMIRLAWTPRWKIFLLMWDFLSGRGSYFRTLRLFF